MSWILLALVGHIANGVAFAIDKILLGSSFKRSATYAGLVGCMSGVALFFVPWVKQWPAGGLSLAAIVSGVTFILALWAFFSALARAEASRVVPIVGSLIPIMTLVGTFLFLGERLSEKNLVGFALLICATLILSGGGKGRPTRPTIWLALTAALLFATSSVTAKAVYDAYGFLGGFISTRIAATLTALVLLLVLDRAAGREALQVIGLYGPKERLTKIQPQQKSAGVFALIGQGAGAFGFLLVQLATSQGSASIVNALQAVQYAFLVIAAIALQTKAPQLLGENLTRRVLIIKSIALAFTACGLLLIV